MYCGKHDKPVEIQALARQTGWPFRVVLCPVCIKDEYQRYINEKTPDGKPKYKVVRGSGKY